MPHITRLARLRDGSCAEASWTWFNPDTARYVARLR
jgi:GntR family transcriptional regulator